MSAIAMVFVVVGAFLLMFLWAAIKILPEYERGVVFFLGRYQSGQCDL